LRRLLINDPRRRRLVLALALALFLLLALAPAALASAIVPESGGSPNADRINSLYKIVLYIAIVIFIGVEGALFYALFRFRARKDAVAAQIRGNTQLEIGWTVGAALILVILAVVTFVKLDSIRTPDNSGPGGIPLAGNSNGVEYALTGTQLPPNGKSLHILVNGQQFIWRYTYPGGTNPNGLDRPFSYEEMVVPTDTTVTLDITAQDVSHSWWIPQLGGKFDAVPGYTNHTWFKIHKPGLYRGQCSLLCGQGHAKMIAAVDAVPPAQFEAWIAYRKAEIASADAAAQAARAKLNSQTGAGAVENP
jgi:cytochrome c oxidase subunit II